MKCFQCNVEMNSKIQNYKDELFGLPNVTLEEIEILSCPNCGEGEISIPNITNLYHCIISYLLSKGKLNRFEREFLNKFINSIETTDDQYEMNLKHITEYEGHWRIDSIKKIGLR